MRVSSVALFGSLSAATIAQDVIEPADFNVTQALLENGVDPSDLPDVTALTKRSLFSGCSLAVSCAFSSLPRP